MVHSPFLSRTQVLLAAYAPPQIKFSFIVWIDLCAGRLGIAQEHPASMSYSSTVSRTPPPPDINKPNLNPENIKFNLFSHESDSRSSNVLLSVSQSDYDHVPGVSAVVVVVGAAVVVKGAAMFVIRAALVIVGADVVVV